MEAQQPFDILKEIITTRRTIVPEVMNGKFIPEALMDEILAAANWAPSHGLTEPWRFVVFGPDQKDAFKQYHADLYKKVSSEKGEFIKVNYEKIRNRAQNASHVIALVMKRGDNPKIPEIEEIAATAAAVQNILLTAHAHGVACYWGSGGMTYHLEMKKFLGFEEQDKVMGLLFFGYTSEEHPKGKRRTEMDAKIIRKKIN
jgi:nitroreductase